MSQRRRFLSRLGIAVLLGVQLFGAGLVPLADARLEASAAGAEVHIEDARDGACAPSHDHQDCVLCQHLAHHDGAAATASVLPAVLPGVEASTTGDNPIPPQPYATPRSRAPPRA